MRLIRQPITQKESIMFTVDMLVEKKACASQVQLFRDTFPNGAPLTVETAISVSHLFDWEFAAQHFLSKEGYKAYLGAKEPHLKDYEDATVPYWKAYQYAEASRLKAYRDARAPLLKAYLDTKELLLKDYEDATVPHWKAYHDATAILWKDYQDATVPHWKAYQDAIASILKAYEDAKAPHWKAYQDAEAQVFAELYIKENS